METQATTIDLSNYDGAPKMRPNGGNVSQVKNKNGIYIAVIAVSFVLTVILYAVAFKNSSASKPNLKPVPPVGQTVEMSK